MSQASQALPLSANFHQASLSMKGLLDQLQEDIASLSLSSSEVYQNLKQSLLQSWERWPEVIENYKVSLQSLPREIRQRPFIRRTFRDIEAFEKDVRQFLLRIKESPFQNVYDAFDRHIKEAEVYLERLQSRIQYIAQQVTDLEENALVQMFLHGEVVLSSKKTIQWERKLFHASLGVFFLYLFAYSGFSQTFIWSVAAPILFAFFSIEIARHFNLRFNALVCHSFRRLMRESEKTRINASIFFIISMAIVYFFFPIEVAILTMLFISIGDPIAGIAGVYWGRTKLSPHTSLEGSLACFIACALLAAVCGTYLFDKTLPFVPLILFSLLSGMIGAAAEASLKKLDDNLVMPLLSAPALWVLMKLFLII